MGTNRLAEMAGMQWSTHLQSTYLTPRFEAIVNGCLYSTMNDADIAKKYIQTSNGLVLVTQAKLVNSYQQPLPGDPLCVIRFCIVKNEFVIHAKCNYAKPLQKLKYILPLISSSKEKIWVISPTTLNIVKSGTLVVVEANKPFKTGGKGNEHIFDCVPGKETMLLEFLHKEIEIKIRIA
jgi:hypothetical protein